MDETNYNGIAGTLKGEVIGAVLTFLNVIGLTLGAVSVQALDGYIPSFELNAIRVAGKHKH